MTTRKPLCVNAGTLNEVETGDTLDPATLAVGVRDGTKFLRDDGTWQAAAGGGGIAMSGSANTYVSLVSTFTILAPDSFTAYTASATYGSVSISGAVITYTAPASAANRIDGEPSCIPVVGGNASSMAISFCQRTRALASTSRKCFT